MSFSTGSRVNQTGWPEPHRHNSGFNIINPRFLRQQAPQPVSDQHPQQQQLSRHSSRLRTTSAPRPVDNEDGRTQSILTTNRENQNQHGAKTSRTPSVTSHYVQYSPPSASQLQRMNSNSASYSFQYTQNKHMSGNDIVMKAMRSREGSRHSSVLTVPYDVPLPQPPARVTFPISRRGSRSSYSRMQSQASLVPDAEKYNGSNPITGAYINIGNSGGGGGGEQPGPNPTASIRTTQQQRSDDKTTPPTVQEDNSVLGDIQGLRVPASMNKSSFSAGSPPRTGNPNGPAANASTGNSFKKNGVRTHFKTSIFTEALPAVEVATTGARSFRNTSDNDPNADSQKVSVNNSSTRSGSFNNNNSVVVVVPPASNNTSNTTATSVSQFNSHGYSTSNTNDSIKLNQDGKLCSAGDSTDVAHCDSIIKPFMNGNNGARHGSAVVEFINPSVSTRSTGNNSREVSSAPTQTQGSAVMSILSSFLSPFSNHTTDVVNHGDAVSSEQHDIGEPVLHSEENVRPLASMRRISGEQNSSWRISSSLLGFQRRLSRISNSFNNNSNHSSNNNNNNSSSNKACEENPPAPIVLKERISISMTDQSVDSGPPSAIPLSRDPSSTPPTGLDMPSNSSAVSTSSMQDVLAGVAAQLELADSMRRVMSPRAFTSVFASQQPDSGTVSSPSDGTDSCVGVESKSPPLLPDANAAVLPTAEDEEECLDGSIKRSTLKFDVSDAEGVPSSSQRPQSTPAEMMSGAASTSPLIGILLKPGGSRRSLTETSSPLVLPVSPPTTSFLFSRRQSNSLGSSSGGIANRKVPGGCRIGRGGALLDHSIVRALNRGDFGDHYQLEFASGSSLAGTNSRQQLANEDGTHRYGNNNAINNDNNNNINNNTNNNNNNNNINNINNINLFPVAGRGLAGHKFSSAFSRVSTNSLGAVEYSARPSIQYEPLQVDFMDEFGTLASGGTNALLLSAACNSAHSLFCSTSDAHAIVPAEGNNTVVRNGDDHVNVSKEYHDGSVDSSSTGEGDQVMGRI